MRDMFLGSNRARAGAVGRAWDQHVTKNGYLPRMLIIDIRFTWSPGYHPVHHRLPLSLSRSVDLLPDPTFYRSIGIEFA